MCFSKSLHPVAWIMLCCHADCRLPFASPHISVRASSPLRSISPFIPSPPSTLKSFEAQMWADSGYFSSRPRQFYVSLALNTHRIEAYRVIMNPNTSEGQTRPRPSRDLPILSCFILICSSSCACASVCRREGSQGQACHFGLWIFGGLVSRLLA